MNKICNTVMVPADHYDELKRQRDDLLDALKDIAEQLADHPACMSVDSSFEDIDAEGGDAAFMTHNLQTAHTAIAKAESNPHLTADDVGERVSVTYY